MTKFYPRKATLAEALVTFGVLIAVMFTGIYFYQADPHMPMFIGVIIASLMALHLGYRWQDIEQMMYAGISQALQAIIILSIIGVLIGIWVLSGVVPAMIYYGLGVLSPAFFLVAALLICSITSLATGTSWGTVGTMGIALLGIAQGLGIPAGLTAGAVISGAYFGDKMSPLSDTTNLAPAMAGTDVFTHVKFMMMPTCLTYGLCILFFGAMGWQYGSSPVDGNAVHVLREGIGQFFAISPWLLLPPLAVIVSIACKVPAIPGITLGILMGAGLGVILQGNNLGMLLHAGYQGFESATGIETIDLLLSTGGLLKMMPSISLTLLAMMFGGIMEKTGQLEVLVEMILRRVHSVTGLVISTMATCLISNATMPEQYISLVIPGRMFAPTYEEWGLHPKTLSNALESSGTVLSALVPWNTCAVFLVGVLGIGTFEYAPYALFNYLMPLVTGLLALAGPAIAWQSPQAKKAFSQRSKKSV